MKPQRVQKALSIREAAWVDALFGAAHGNKREAGRIAGYSKNPASLAKQVKALMGRPHVVAAIGARQAGLRARNMVSEDRLVEELRRIAFVDMADLATWGGDRVSLRDSADLTADQTAAIAEVSEGKEGLKLKLHDKLGAIKLLMTKLGMLVERHKHEVEAGVEVHLYVPANGREVPKDVTPQQPALQAGDEG